MSVLFEQVKKYYTLGIYKDRHVADFVKKEKITPEEYKLITKKEYEE